MYAQCTKVLETVKASMQAPILLPDKDHANMVTAAATITSITTITVLLLGLHGYIPATIRNKDVTVTILIYGLINLSIVMYVMAQLAIMLIIQSIQ